MAGARLEKIIATFTWLYSKWHWPELPPVGVVSFAGRHTFENLPSPLVDQISERQERNLVERLVHKEVNVSVWWTILYVLNIIIIII